MTNAVNALTEKVLSNLVKSQYTCPICKESYMEYHYGTTDEWILRGLELKSKTCTDSFTTLTYHCHSCLNDFTITKLKYVDNNANIIANTHPLFEIIFNDNKIMKITK